MMVSKKSESPNFHGGPYFQVQNVSFREAKDTKPRSLFIGFHQGLVPCDPRKTNENGHAIPAGFKAEREVPLVVGVFFFFRNWYEEIEVMMKFYGSVSQND